MRDLLELAIEQPMIFNQLWYDMELADEVERSKNGVPWKKPGETIRAARDRLRAEREAAKRRLAEPTG